MSNSHGYPDTLREMQGIDFDLLPTCIVGGGVPEPPASGLTLAAFPTRGFVRRGALLLYVDQPAQAITLPNVSGTYYLLLTADTTAGLAGWTRVPGSHYAFLLSAVPPVTPDGGLVFANAVVTTPHITGVTANLAAPPLSRQNSNSVNITGGMIQNLSLFSVAGLATGQRWQVLTQPGNDVIGFYTDIAAAGGTNRWSLLTGDAPSQFGGTVQALGHVGIGVTPGGPGVSGLEVAGATYLLGNTGVLKPNGSAFTYNLEVHGTAAKPGGGVWSDLTSRRALKKNIRSLTGGLATLLRLRPRQWEWADHRPDLAALLPGTRMGFVVEELEDDMPAWVAQGLDGQKGYTEQGVTALLVDALRELTHRIEALEARRAP